MRLTTLADVRSFHRLRHTRSDVRDQRFVAAHRGGPLDVVAHRLLAAWAAACAARVLPLFERGSTDPRPRHAVDVARAWARGDVPSGAAVAAARAAHRAAREATSPAATAAARAAGHAAATAHMADHCLGPVVYGGQAVAAGGGSAASEYAWQRAQIPEAVQALVVAVVAGPRFRRHR